jgi:hypothetical protein
MSCRGCSRGTHNSCQACVLTTHSRCSRHPADADCLAELEAGMGLSYPPDTELAQRCNTMALLPECHVADKLLASGINMLLLSTSP